MDSLYYFSVFIIGLLAGSFLNCVIYRLEIGESFLKGRSYCPECKRTIGWFDLIPVLSFLMLKGKCRHCKGRISWQYPLVELATAFGFLAVFIGFPETGAAEKAYLLFITFVLILIFAYDLKHFIIPDEAIVAGVSVSFLWIAVSTFSLNEIIPFILSGLGASGFFLALFVVSKGRWIGFGDVKLGLLMGLFLGFPGTIIALFSSFLIGAIIGTTLILLGKKGLKSEIPFAPFLITGTFLALFRGEAILSGYLAFFSIY